MLHFFSDNLMQVCQKCTNARLVRTKRYQGTECIQQARYCYMYQCGLKLIELTVGGNAGIIRLLCYCLAVPPTGFYSP